MRPRKKTAYTQELVDNQLQQIHLLDTSSPSENLEQLGPIIKQIHASRQQETYLKTLQALIQAKEQEIEKICSDNYQDFVSSVSTLLSVRSYTLNLREKILSLDSSVSNVGHGLAAKKASLLKSKRTAANMDEAIDVLQACLKVLDLVYRVGELVKEGKYWSALRSLEDIQTLPPSSLSQTPFFIHLLSSLPSLRNQVKEAVTASTNSWLLEIRNVSGDVGRLALEAMETRTKRWKARQEKEPLLRLSQIGSSVEMVTNEKIEYDVLDNDKVQVDFKPLYQCILIYNALDSLEELQRSYHADRKAQSTLILPTPLSLPSLSVIIPEIIGFFIIESHVLRTTKGFRSEREVEELWIDIVSRVGEGLNQVLINQTDPEVFLDVKESLAAFSATLEIISKDDYLPMMVETTEERDMVLNTVWIGEQRDTELRATLAIQTFVQKYYQFVDGVSQYQRDTDELLGKAVDRLLTSNVSEAIGDRLPKISGLSQLAQVVSNLEYFELCCSELEHHVTSMRSSHRGRTIHLSAGAEFAKTLTRAISRINTIISSKLDDFFELADYEWTPSNQEGTPSMYLYELVNWLTTVVDGLNIKDVYKDEAYKGAVAHVADSLVEFITGRHVTAINENALSNLLVDVGFIEEELGRGGRGHLSPVFNELKADAVQRYLVPTVRQTSYSSVKPKRLAILLEKMARAGLQSRDPIQRERGLKKQKEAEAVGRLFPGESK
ncbi:hypothetical protein Clacol_001818 [Clathrus columnatus]|uniref:Exocyst complex component SEC15 n=1 Tax=Clathrus columnatus TaxID=1419009 RepID=A0AAV5A4D3_9AGAM|nr:hypothetical protein Clacol_001818 [Clathrus columnatus]